MVEETLVSNAGGFQVPSSLPGCPARKETPMLKSLFACLAGTAMVTSAAFAGGPVLLVQGGPEPAPVIAPTPMAAPGAPEAVAPGGMPVVTSGDPVTLYHCVRYKQERNIAPCAVPQVVFVKDPCAVCDPCNPCAAPACVAVQICVPPCTPCPPKVTCKRGGEYVKYDYGKYAVQITSRKGVVTVDYDD